MFCFLGRCRFGSDQDAQAKCYFGHLVSLEGGWTGHTQTMTPFFENAFTRLAVRKCVVQVDEMSATNKLQGLFAYPKGFRS
jgi:hypothetical protein